MHANTRLAYISHVPSKNYKFTRLFTFAFRMHVTHRPNKHHYIFLNQCGLIHMCNQVSLILFNDSKVTLIYANYFMRSIWSSHSSAAKLSITLDWRWVVEQCLCLHRYWLTLFNRVDKIQVEHITGETAKLMKWIHFHF